LCAVFLSIISTLKQHTTFLCIISTLKQHTTFQASFQRWNNTQTSVETTWLCIVSTLKWRLKRLYVVSTLKWHLSRLYVVSTLTWCFCFNVEMTLKNVVKNHFNVETTYNLLTHHFNVETTHNLSSIISTLKQHTTFCWNNIQHF
jgi:hypothetical protein